MTPKQREALVRAVAEITKRRAPHTSIEAFARDHFWKYYQIRKKTNRKWSLDEFFEQIPKKSQVTKSDRMKEAEKEHAALIDIISAELMSFEKPVGPLPEDPTPVDNPNSDGQQTTDPPPKDTKPIDPPPVDPTPIKPPADILLQNPPAGNKSDKKKKR